jgi:hypothetical protein
MSEPAAVVDDKKGGKTAFCTICNKRHRLAFWPHDGEQGRGLDDAATITGAHNAEELSEQTAAQITRADKRAGKEKAKEEKLSPDEIARRKAAASKVGRKACALTFTGIAFVTVNPLWRSELLETEIAEVGDDFADFALAWGVEATGKVLSAIVLACGLAEVGGKVASRVKAHDLNDTFDTNAPSDTAKNA